MKSDVRRGQESGSHDGHGAVGTSLWLVSEDSQASRRLADMINTLARSFGTPRFEPHVTLLGGLEGPEGEIVRQSTALARALPHLELRFRGIEGSEEYFRCVFATMEPTSEFLRARERALELFGGHREPHFTPHISLVYGRLAPEAKAAMIRALGEYLVGALTCRQLQVMRTQGPPERWQCLATLALGVGQSG